MFLQNLVAALNEAIFSITSGLKMHFADYCNLDAPITEHIILARDGSLLTVFRIDGVNAVQPADTFQYVIQALSAQLSPSFQRKGLILQSVFSSDPSHSTIKAALSNITSPSMFSIEKMGYNKEAAQLLKQQEDCLLEIVAIEKNFMCVWTTSACLTPQEVKEMAEDYKEKMKNTPNLGHGANPYRAHKLMIDNHKKNIEAVHVALSRCGIKSEPLFVSEAIHEMRMGILVSPERDVNVIGGRGNNGLKMDWNTSATSIALTERHVSRTRVQYDGSFPRLNEFAKVEVEYAGNNKQVLIDGVYFQPTLVEKMPSDIKFFNYLFADLSQLRSRNQRIPYRMLFTLASDGDSLLQLKYPLATVLRGTNIDTMGIYEGARQIKGFLEEQGVVVQLSMHILTWGKTSEEASLRSSIMNTRIENWGTPRLSINTGNPIEGFATCSMGFSKYGIANRAAAPLDRALCFLPLARPSSLWKHSPIIFRSQDGKPIPYVPMATEFTYWVTFVAATPGSGKSVLANWLNTAFYLSGGLESLPYVSIIDFGFSSKGFINVLKRFLPPHQEHYATYQRIENNRKYCVNPFQLGLGLRFATSSEIEFTVNLLTMATIDTSTGAPMPGAHEFIYSVVREAYNRYSDCYVNFPNATPKIYNRGVEPEIDKILDMHGFSIVDDDHIELQRKYNQTLQQTGFDLKTTWFDVVDFLMSTKPIDSTYGPNYTREAQRAQRYTAPVIDDLSEVIKNTDAFKTKYKTTTDQHGRPFIDSICDKFSEFSKNFPIFSGVTQFDVEDARAISFDLEAEVKGNETSVAGQLKNALMYMYTLRTATSKFFMVQDDLKTDFPLPKGITPPAGMNLKAVEEFHYKNVITMFQSKKRIMVDEFHYTGASESLMRTFASFMRVVRKRNMELLLISQKLEDFVYFGAANGSNEIDLLTFATTVFILSPQHGKQLEFVAEKLNITDRGTLHALQSEIRLPKESPMTGGSLFLWLNFGKNQYTYILTNKLSNLCLWNFDTTVENVKLRDALTKVTLNETEALNILADSFEPHRTSQMVESVRNELRERGNTEDDAYDVLARNLELRFRRKHSSM